MRQYYYQNNQIAHVLQKMYTNGIRIQSNFWEDSVIQIIGAFFGALFAFAASMLTLWVNKKRERFILHKNAVVKLEYLLWDHYDLNYRNAAQINSVINILRKPKHLTYDRLYILRIPEELKTELGDLDIINPYSNYLQSVNRINSNSKTLNSVLDMWFQMMIVQHPPSRYEVDNVTEQLKNMISVNEEFDKEIEKMLAIIRIYMKKLSDRSEKGFNIFKLNNYSKITNQEINLEIEKIKIDVEENNKNE